MALLLKPKAPQLKVCLDTAVVVIDRMTTNNADRITTPESYFPWRSKASPNGR
jgi:hypothetical protein